MQISSLRVERWSGLSLGCGERAAPRRPASACVALPLDMCRRRKLRLYELACVSSRQPQLEPRQDPHSEPWTRTRLGSGSGSRVAVPGVTRLFYYVYWPFAVLGLHSLPWALARRICSKRGLIFPHTRAQEIYSRRPRRNRVPPSPKMARQKGWGRCRAWSWNLLRHHLACSTSTQARWRGISSSPLLSTVWPR